MMARRYARRIKPLRLKDDAPEPPVMPQRPLMAWQSLEWSYGEAAPAVMNALQGPFGRVVG